MVRGRRRFAEKSLLARTFENILFLAEVFTEESSSEIPNVPMLELARSFELSRPTLKRRSRRLSRPWALWD